MFLYMGIIKDKGHKLGCLKINGIYERDIDTALSGLFCLSPDMQTWLINRCGAISTNFQLTKSTVSSQTYNGESDIEVRFANDNQDTIRILIENKIKSSFQPNQHKRYLERAKYLENLTRNTKVYILLLAPQTYSESQKDFEIVITYEELRAELSHLHSDLASYLVSLLSQAIERAVTGWNRVTDEPISNLWLKYYEIANSEFPELAMPEPAFNKPARAGFVRFNCIPKKRFKLMHKFSHGNIDIQISGGKVKSSLINSLFHRFPDFCIQQAGTSVALRRKVSILTPSDPEAEQVQKIREGLMNAKKLYSFYNENQELFAKIF